VVRGEFTSIDVGRFQKELGGDVQVVDVRTAGERARGVIPGAVAIGVDEVRDRTHELDAGRRIVFYCATGYRSYLAAKVAIHKGFDRPESLSGGTFAWRAAGGPLSGEDKPETSGPASGS